MAITCNNINEVSNDSSKVYDLINTEGKNLLDKIYMTFNNLRVHWIGPDARKNLERLKVVYDATCEYLLAFQKVIVEVHNEHILPLQKEVVASGGTAAVGSELSVQLKFDGLVLPPETERVYVEQQIIHDAAEFNDVPESFSSFMSMLDDATKVLFQNWADGAGHASVVNAYSEFSNSSSTFTNSLTVVRDDINTVIANKKGLL